jgi:hypothetical protein
MQHSVIDIFDKTRFIELEKALDNITYDGKTKPMNHGQRVDLGYTLKTSLKALNTIQKITKLQSDFIFRASKPLLV